VHLIVSILRDHWRSIRRRTRFGRLLVEQWHFNFDDFSLNCTIRDF
jgi:hypothetical protein